MNDGDRQPSARSLRGLDGLNLLMADVRDGLGPYLSVYLKGSQHWSASDIGIAMATSSVAAAIFQMPAGLLVDALRAKRLLVAGSGLLVALGCILIAQFPSLGTIIAAQVLIGAASAVIPPALAALSLGLVGRKRLDNRISRNESFNHAGNFMAASLAGALGQWLGYNWIFYLVCAFAIGSAAVVAMINSGEIDHDLARGGEAATPDGGHGSPLPLRDLFQRRDLVIFLVAVMLFHFGNAAMLPMAGQVLAQTHPGSDTIALSACIIAAQLVMIGVAWAVGRAMTAGVGRKTIFLVALAILPIRGVLFSFTANPVGVVAIQLLDGVAAGIFGVIAIVIASDLMQGTGRFNLAQGLVALAVGLGAGLSNLASGFIVQAFGYPAGFLSLAAIALGALVFFAAFMPETRSAKTERGAGFGRDRAGDTLIGGLSASTVATLAIMAVAMLCILFRPWRLPEAVPAVLGALALVLFGLLPSTAALRGVAKGADVYLFLAGMMLMSELARANGFFDWLAGVAASHARGSSRRLFALVYLVGIVVTVFLSNDATAVVLTPAVYATARAADAEPLPLLYICAFVANAASFVLPISNPANLVMFGAHMPPLIEWIARFGPPSVVAIVATYVVLRFMQRTHLGKPTNVTPHVPALGRGGKIVAIALLASAILLLAVSAIGGDLGLPTAIAGALTLVLVAAFEGASTFGALRQVSWSVLPLVAGLFVFVEALDGIGVLATVSGWLAAASRDPGHAAWIAALATGLGSNVANNLPVGLLSGAAIAAARPPTSVIDAIVIGVDLGPNLSITGSLATLLWLVAIRREGEHVGAFQFLKLGAVVMPAALLPAIAVRMLGP